MYAMSCEVAVNTNCHFAHACWASIDLIVGHDDPFSTLDHLGDQLRIPFFMEFIIVMSWCIWMQRNDFIFKEVPPTQASCVQHFKKEFAIVILRAKPRYKSQMSLWLEALV